MGPRQIVLFEYQLSASLLNFMLDREKSEARKEKQAKKLGRAQDIRGCYEGKSKFN